MLRQAQHEREPARERPCSAPPEPAEGRAAFALMESPQSETVLYLRALDLYASSPFLDFEDALSAAYIEKQGLTEILSYDADFDRVSGIVRQEP